MVIIDSDRDQNARNSRQFVNVRDRKGRKSSCPAPVPTIHKCNYEAGQSKKLTLARLITGGHETQKNEYPFMAALLRVSSWSNRPTQICGGSLIDESHILTAAHCIEGLRTSDVNSLRVYLGAHDIKSSTEVRSEHRVMRIIKHKDFDTRTLVNDIAILTLETPARISDTIQTICLPNYDATHVGEKLTVAGWGTLSEGGLQPNKLHEVDVKVLSNARCKQKYDHIIPGTIVPTMICAADNPGKDACSGDSGGPLFTKRNGYIVQEGIVSWGVGCARSDSPGVYTSVSKFFKWIQRIQECY